jgi:uncharacterized membrane protein YbhN (UPF0104 family)
VSAGSKLLRIVATLAAIALLAWRIDGRAVLAQLAHLDARFIAAFVALSLPLYFVCAARWSFTAARLEAPVPLRRAFLDYYVSTLLNQLLPFGVAGDVVRAARHRAQPVILERLSGVAALALWVAASMRAWWAVALIAIALALIARHRAWRAALWDRGALAVQLALSLVAVALLLALYACAGRAVGVALDAATVMRGVPLLLAATTVPWAFAGWGVREAAAAALWRSMGQEPSAGVAVSIAFGLLSLLAAAPGLVVLALPLPKRVQP